MSSALLDDLTKVKSTNIPVTSTKVDVANWLQQAESKFKFQSILQRASEDWHDANSEGVRERDCKHPGNQIPRLARCQ